MSHAMTRRTFLKISGSTVIGGLAAYAGLSVLARGGAAREPRAGEERVVPTFCELCFWKCGVLAHVRDGRVVKLVGNPAHPLSNGRLCPRGVAGMSALYDPDRLRQPLLRVREGGQERWKEVSWEEALAHTGRRLLEIKEKHGAGSIALFSHGHGGGFFKTLLAGLGSHT
ncbi:MAG: hypothetical protein FJ125_16900, partial [Deltaproteobacteria bacterium]|nr:hypothetical protein [Deltaproteobacteria bacterium]